MSSRTTRLVALAAVGLLLAACGPVSPGSAAVVDGRRISMDSADAATSAYCRLTLLNAEQQGVTEVDNAQVRQQALSDLIAAAVADRLADNSGVDVPDSSVSAADLEQITTLFPDDVDAVVDAIERNQRTNAIATALGEKAGKSGDEALEAGRQEIVASIDDAKLKVDPRFGISQAAQVVSTSGSLSVAGGALDDVASEDLPVALKCT